MGQLLKNAKMLDGKNNLIQKDVLIENGVIREVYEQISEEGHEIWDLEGLLLVPGFIDLHVHLREPGGEHKETIESGTKAAVKGGYTTIAAMPNTRPVPDNKAMMDALMDRIEKTAHCRVLPYASITERQAGKSMTDFSELLRAGAFAFTDDGVGVQSAGMMLAAMKEANKCNTVIVAHCEDNTLLPKGGAVHEGMFAQKENIPGIPSVSESVHVARDVLLAEAADARYHVCHVSTKETVRVIADAKRAGIKVTAEVTPHHLLLSDSDIPGQDSNFKMNPPLRGTEDKEALLEALKEGVIDFIATDHAPHHEDEKAQGMELAPFGIVGLETSFPLLYTNLVLKGKWTLQGLMDAMTRKPAEAFSLPYGKIEPGLAADLCVIDLNRKEIIDSKGFASKGKNTPFNGWECSGWPVATIVGGKIAYKKEEALIW
ncbi:dihydroorotase [Fictibacillus aquaticus]|uniref:Dihydroorotase n=1 Tax=Fictibacillus aquaticus TaxID=2021314 RepID=A0A235FC19_9BACL|nr:dihydroorotase [Fictibacillus aquaticus]OYD58920.1 dihydroorotase [Fictibacillus aquaticus]